MTSAPGGAAGPATGSATAVTDWVVFGCGGHSFGLPVGRVREITPIRAATRLPGCGSEIVGLVALRGGVLTVLDFGAAFGVGAARSSSEERRMLLVEYGERVLGFVVDRVVGVARGAELTLDRATLRGLDVERTDVLGVGTHAGLAFLAVDADPILDRLLA